MTSLNVAVLTRLQKDFLAMFICQAVKHFNNCSIYESFMYSTPKIVFQFQITLVMFHSITLNPLPFKNQFHSTRFHLPLLEGPCGHARGGPDQGGRQRHGFEWGTEGESEPVQGRVSGRPDLPTGRSSECR